VMCNNSREEISKTTGSVIVIFLWHVLVTTVAMET